MVVIVGAVMLAVINIESPFESSPASFVALTVMLNVPSALGVPEIIPFVARVKPGGNGPLARLQIMGAVPEAARVWLYGTPIAPSGRLAVVIAGAIDVTGCRPGKESSQARKSKTIIVKPINNFFIIYLLPSHH